MIAKTFAPGKGVEPFVIMVVARNVSIYKSGITGYSGLGLRDRLGRERHTQLIAIRVAADDALARGDDADQ